MNATTQSEQTALTLPQRAAVALGESANEAKLRELVAKSAGIVAVTNSDGREEAHRAGMVLLKTRTGIRATGKAARDDATKFSKAVIAMEDELIGIIEPEETRVLALRDKWDEAVAAEKAAKIAAERVRVDAIQVRINSVRNLPTTAVGKSAAEISQIIYELADTISEDDEHAATFDEFATDYKAVRTEVLDLLAKAETKQLGVEQAAREAEQARLAEIARIAAEREELAQLRAAAAETARLAKIESDRIAAEQAAEAKRLADLAAAQEAAAAQLRAKAEANLKAERDAQELAMRLERERVATEQAAANAELKAAQDKLAAEVAAHNAAIAAQQDAARREDDHGPALLMNAAYDACARYPEVLAEQAREEAALADLADHLVDSDLWPEDSEIVSEIRAMFMTQWGMDEAQADARMGRFDYAAAAEMDRACHE